MEKKAKALPRDDEGATLIITVFFLMVFLILLAFAVDLGRAYVVRIKLQNVADAAALAGGQNLPASDPFSCGAGSAQTKAIYYANLNGYALPCSLSAMSVTGDKQKITVYTAVDMPMFFGGVVGLPSMHITAHAAASRISSGAGSAIFAQNNITFNGGTTVIGSVTARGNVTNNGNGTNVSVGTTTGGTLTNNGSKSSFGIVTQHATVVTVSQYAESIGLTDYIAALPTGSTRLIVNGGCTVDERWFQLNPRIEFLYCKGSMSIKEPIPPGHPLRAIRADQTITFEDKTDGFTFGSPENPVLVYASNGSSTGSIEIKRDTIVYGTLYAPFQTVKVNGGKKLALYGSLIAKEVTMDGNSALVDSRTDIFGTIKVRLVE